MSLAPVEGPPKHPGAPSLSAGQSQGAPEAFWNGGADASKAPSQVAGAPEAIGASGSSMPGLTATGPPLPLKQQLGFLSYASPAATAAPPDGGAPAAGALISLQVLPVGAPLGSPQPQLFPVGDLTQGPQKSLQWSLEPPGASPSRKSHSAPPLPFSAAGTTAPPSPAEVIAAGVTSGIDMGPFLPATGICDRITYTTVADAVATGLCDTMRDSMSDAVTKGIATTVDVSPPAEAMCNGVCSSAMAASLSEGISSSMGASPAEDIVDRICNYMSDMMCAGGSERMCDIMATSPAEGMMCDRLSNGMAAPMALSPCEGLSSAVSPSYGMRLSREDPFGPPLPSACLSPPTPYGVNPLPLINGVNQNTVLNKSLNRNQQQSPVVPSVMIWAPDFAPSGPLQQQQQQIVRPAAAIAITAALRDHLACIISEVYRQVPEAPGVHTKRGLPEGSFLLPLAGYCSSEEGSSSPNCSGISPICSNNSTIYSISASKSSSAAAQRDEEQNTKCSSSCRTSNSSTSSNVAIPDPALACKAKANDAPLAAAAADEETIHISVVREGSPEQLAPYLDLLVPFLSSAPQDLRNTNPQSLLYARARLADLQQQLQKQQLEQQQQQLQVLSPQQQVLAPQQQALSSQQQVSPQCRAYGENLAWLPSRAAATAEAADEAMLQACSSEGHPYGYLGPLTSARDANAEALPQQPSPLLGPPAAEPAPVNGMMMPVARVGPPPYFSNGVPFSPPGGPLGNAAGGPLSIEDSSGAPAVPPLWTAATAQTAMGAMPVVAAASVPPARPPYLPQKKKPNPADLGRVISAEGLCRSPRGNVQVFHSKQHEAWLVLCCAGVGESRAFCTDQLGFEGAKRMALLYASQCRRHLSSRRAAAAKAALAMGLVPEAAPDRHARVKGLDGSVPALSKLNLCSSGPPGGRFNLVECSGITAFTTRSDVSASRVARLSRRAMELPYVHGVRFEPETFAWVAQMRGETRRFLVKKHGFVKSRLCAVEKIHAWRASLPEEAFAEELKMEQDVLELLRTTPPRAHALLPPPLSPPLSNISLQSPTPTLPPLSPQQELLGTPQQEPCTPLPEPGPRLQLLGPTLQQLSPTLQQIPQRQMSAPPLQEANQVLQQLGPSLEEVGPHTDVPVHQKVLY